MFLLINSCVAKVFIIFTKKQHMKYLLLLISLLSFKGFSQSYIDYYFNSNGIKGAIVIYNTNTQQWVFNNESEAYTNSPAASHFHLWQTLVGLEEKVLNSSPTVIYKWDGIKRSYFGDRKNEWNKDMNLIEALKSKNDFFFNQLKTSLNQNSYQSNIKNSSLLKQVASDDEYFWNYSGLTNPNTMIMFFKDLYEEKLSFNKKSQEFLKNQLALDSSLLLNTSTTSYQGKKITWTVGVYLKQDKPIYFSYRTYYYLDEELSDQYHLKRNKVLSEIFQALNL